MNVFSRLSFLGEAGYYDKCWASREKKSNNLPPGVYSCGVNCRLFRTLLSNDCVMDCGYCINSSQVNSRKERIEPKEVAEIFSKYFFKKIVNGAFISSSCRENSCEEILETARLLRFNHHYRGYLHMKALPGMSFTELKELCSLSNRVSINLEAPSSSRLSELSSTKDFEKDLMQMLEWLSFFCRRGFLSNGVSTQFVVGANDESDLEYLQLSLKLYRDLGLNRVYYSAFEPVSGTRFSERKGVSLIRELRLYQADFLIKDYGFSLNEVKTIVGEDDCLFLEKDPKLVFALNNPQLFPVDVNEASFNQLIRVPGIGLKTARNILKYRLEKRIDSKKVLAQLGVNLRKAFGFFCFPGLNEGKQLSLIQF